MCSISALQNTKQTISLPSAFRRSTVVVSVLIFALVLPSLVWCLFDHSVWPWDQSFFGYWTLKTWAAHRSGPWSWLLAMGHAGGYFSPLIIWLGQFLVPLRHLTGQFESALLLLNVAADIVILCLVNAIARDLGCGLTERIAAILACGGAGIVVGLCHQFWSETAQCAAATFTIYVSLRADRMSVLRSIALLVIAISISLLAKASSAIFFVPLTVYAAVSLFLGRHRLRQSANFFDTALVVFACLTASATVIWYYANWASVRWYVLNSTVEGIALFWGSPVDLGRKIPFWTWSLGHSISVFVWVSAILAILILSALFIAISRAYQRGPYEWIEKLWNDGTLFAMTLAGSVVATVLAFSLQINETTKYLITTTPMVALLVGWSLSVLRVRLLSAAVVVFLAFNAAINHLQSEGVYPLRITPYGYLDALDFRGLDQKLLQEAVRVSCPRDIGDRLNVFAVDYKNVNATSATFYSAKMTFRADWTCRFTNLGFAPTDLNTALDKISALAPPFVVTVDVQRQPPPDFVNRLSKPVAEWLAQNPSYVRETLLENGILIYRERTPATAKR